MSFSDWIGSFMLASLLAAFGENVLLNRGIGFSDTIRIGKRKKYDLLVYMGLLTTMMTLSALPLYAVKQLLQNSQYAYLLIPFVYVLLMTATYFAVYTFVEHYMLLQAKTILKVLPLATFNCTAISGVLFANMKYVTLSETLAYCIGSGVGYTIAVVIITEGVRRIELSDIPKPFRGIPIMLLYVGFLSLVIKGLSGK